MFLNENFHEPHREFCLGFFYYSFILFLCVRILFVCLFSSGVIVLFENGLDHVQDPKLEEESVKTDLGNSCFLEETDVESGEQHQILVLTPVILLSYLSLTCALKIPLVIHKRDHI